MARTDTKQRILEAARLTVQARGYTGLSFRELAKDLGIKSAGIHYYYPSKGELGGALAERYTSDFSEYLEIVLTEFSDAEVCIEKFTAVFRETLLNENRMCLGGMMAAEHEELPIEVRVEVGKFSAMCVRWLTGILSRSADVSGNIEATESRALAIFAAIQGAQLVAHGRHDVSLYDRAIGGYRACGLLP